MRNDLLYRKARMAPYVKEMAKSPSSSVASERLALTYRVQKLFLSKNSPFKKENENVEEPLNWRTE